MWQISSLIFIMIFFILFNNHFIISVNAMGLTEIYQKFLTDLTCNSIPVNYKEIDTLLKDEKNIECKIPLDVLEGLNGKVKALITCITGNYGSGGCMEAISP